MLDLIGRFHILLLHLPIGILLLGVIFEWLHFVKFTSIPDHIRSLVFGIGSMSALFATITGYLLSTSGDYNYKLVENHQWAGVAVTILAILTWITIVKKKNKLSPWLALIVSFGLAVTGHLGGTITHGDGFLTLQSDADEISDIPIFNIDDIPNAIVFEDVIQPIMQAKCVGCHGSNKMKGKLRLDAYELMLKGGKSKMDLLSKVHGESELVNRLDLPVSNDEHMPPKDKRQLTEDERSILDIWIAHGFSPSTKVSELENDTSNVVLIKRIIETSSDINNHHEGATIAAETPNVEIPHISEDQLMALRSLGIVILPAGEESAFLEVNFVNIKDITNEHWEGLKNIAPNIIRLKLSDINVSDINMPLIKEMTHLTKLYLDHTDISDEGIFHLKNLKFLNYLNLNNTEITNEGIESLEEMKNIKTIYAYQTKVNKSGLETTIDLETGNYKLESYSHDTIRISQN